MQLSGLVYKFLSGLKQLMIPSEGSIEDFPYAESAVWKHLCHLLPIFFTLSSYQVFFLSLGKLFE